MAIQTTRPALDRTFRYHIGIPYSEAAHLLRYEEKSFYNSGIYGWNFSTYIFDDVAISTGYRNLPTTCNYELVKEYDKKARNIINEWNYQGDKKQDIRALLHEFIARQIKLFQA